MPNCCARCSILLRSSNTPRDPPCSQTDLCFTLRPRNMRLHNFRMLYWRLVVLDFISDIRDRRILLRCLHIPLGILLRNATDDPHWFEVSFVKILKSMTSTGVKGLLPSRDLQ